MEIQEPKPKKKFLIPFIIIIGILVVGVGIFAYQNYINSKWKIFKNTRCGFELQYPGNWIVDENIYHISLFDEKTICRLMITNSSQKEYGIFDIAILENDYGNDYLKEQLTVIEKIKGKVKENSAEIYKYYKFDDILIDGVNAVNKTYDISAEGRRSVEATYYLLDKNAVIWAYSHDIGEEKYKDKVEHILSTFKFLD